MKQNKAEKLLAGVLSISLAMGVSVMPAFAASGETYADMDSVVIKKNYELANEGTFSPAETFSFDIEADNVTDASDDITPENMPMPTIGTVSYLRGEAGSTTKTKEIKIDLPEYDSVGVYTYIIHEVAGHSAGVTYYGDAILLRVTSSRTASSELPLSTPRTRSPPARARRTTSTTSTLPVSWKSTRTSRASWAIRTNTSSSRCS